MPSVSVLSSPGSVGGVLAIVVVAIAIVTSIVRSHSRSDRCIELETLIRLLVYLFTHSINGAQSIHFFDDNVLFGIVR